ncbi:MAG TPA: magnesium and cobalt transport protein CorA [Sphingobium sp.]|uniref:magnesium and cobalt transport protein CorA n=1 Tax=unclassified Sphingobium TaxID=2611147 RepID=UPI0007F51771|nr:MULTISPECIES: magnesium and cobalt transport protein CorA [unclassified Sphingobium]OAN57961.1 magnesium transporter [Sphingobium sp. TCM1]HAF41923.1 magnesium and cobalt transport protein CorA [Sphingobium sp.]
MTVIAAYLYRNGQCVRPVSIDERIACAADKSEFVWIGLADPSDDEMHRLQRTYDLHPLAVEDAIKANQLPKVDLYGDQLFVVARTAYLEADAISYGETAIFVGHSHIISVRHGSARAHLTLRHDLEAVPARLAQGVDYVLHAILDFIVDGYLPIIEGIEDEVLAMEQQMIDHFLGRDDITRIFNLRRQLIRFQRILVPMQEVATKFVKVELPCIDAEARAYFSDVRDHVRRVQVMVDDLREVLSSVFESSNLLEQQRTGAITRQLAAWAAILAVPTAIAGIYGMNFEHMPELKTRYGYFVVLGVITVICSLLYARFKRLKWL